MMRKSIFKTFENTIRHWYIPAIVGLIFVAVGIYTFTSPLNSFIALAFVFSISFMVTGLSEVIFSLTNKDEMDNWGWMLAFGIISFIIGALLFVNPDVSMITMTFYVGFLILFRSISAISFSLDLKDYGISDWGVMMALGIIGLIFSFFMIWNPAFGGMTIVIWTGLALITTGIFSLYLSFKLKKLNDLPNKLPEDLKLRLKQIQQEIDDYRHKTFK